MLSEPDQIVGGANAILAETEIGPDDHMGQAKALGDDIMGKIPGRQTGQSGVEIQLIKPVHAEFFQAMRPRFRIHQPERRGVGRKITAGVGFEGQNTQGRVGHSRARHIDHRLVAQVNTVEIANRGAGAAILGFDEMIIPNDPHGASRSAGAIRFKRHLATERRSR